MDISVKSIIKYGLLVTGLLCKCCIHILLTIDSSVAVDIEWLHLLATTYIHYHLIIFV